MALKTASWGGGIALDLEIAWLYRHPSSSLSLSVPSFVNLGLRAWVPRATAQHALTLALR
eukprot:scaffold127957_cov29-Tisochrysis_lutea.AAC.4